MFILHFQQSLLFESKFIAIPPRPITQINNSTGHIVVMCCVVHAPVCA